MMADAIPVTGVPAAVFSILAQLAGVPVVKPGGETAVRFGSSPGARVHTCTSGVPVNSVTRVPMAPRCSRIAGSSAPPGPVPSMR